jgi:hemolysin activation/secretion protein
VVRLKDAVAALALARLLSAGAAHAQALERHLPPPPPEAPPSLSAPPTTPASSDDDRPLGVDLRQVVVLGPDDPPLSGAGAAAPRLVVQSSMRAAPVRARALERALTPYFGRALSRRRIGEIEAAVVRLWRGAGHSLLDVSTPPQELSNGRLQIRVVEYRLGQVSIPGASGARRARILDSLRLRPDAPIDLETLSQDLQWLDRDPFRSLRAAFAAGAEPGQTDLRLTAAYSRPFSLSAGWDNTGPASTGRERYFVGAQIGLPLDDAALSYQQTASPDYWESDGRLLQQPHPRYLSEALRLETPLAPRQALELTLDEVQTNQTIQDFETRLTTTEASLAYRFALSNLLGALPGEMLMGLEAKRQSRDVLFGGAEASAQAANVHQAFIGWSAGWSDAHGHTQLDTSLRLSPGSLGAGDTAAALAAISMGRVRSPDYLYARADVSRTTRLPLGLVLSSEANGQVADRALPDTEQMALGGAAAVRGYSLDDGAYDSAMVIRNDLQAGALARRFGPAVLGAPGLTLDLGAGSGGSGPRRDAQFGSVGVEETVAIGALAASANVSDPWTNGPATRSGRLRFDVRVTAAF